MPQETHRQVNQNMEIQLEKINTDVYDVREEVDEDHVDDIAESLKADGQWNPIIVRPSEDGSYDLIAGHTRYRAAKKIGWDSLDATVKDIDGERAYELALKTNLKRKGMDKLEEGRVINEMMDQYGLNQSELAKKLDKSNRWVSERMRVALELDPKVKGLVQEDELSYNIARIVTQVDEDRQLDFAELLMEQEITQAAEASRLKHRFENDTLYTIGYEGLDFDEFVNKLEENEIEIVLDVRQSTDSNYKPEFNGEILEQRMPENDIEYRHDPDLGVHWTVRRAYKDRAIGHDCFADWYRWWIHEESDIDLLDLASDIERSGTTALLCIEKYASPEGDQEHYCHRHHLAEEIQSLEQDGRKLFPNRQDL